MGTIPVGLGELKISSDPDDVLTIYGLGSCVGIGIYDPVAGVAGLLHAVLPEGKPEENGSPKFVDSGIDSLLEGVIQEGGVKRRLQVRLVGGANLLTAPGHQGTFNIGSRNIDMAHSTLDSLKLSIKAQETGGNIGRTMRLYVRDGRTTVRSMGKPERQLVDGGT